MQRNKQSQQLSQKQQDRNRKQSRSRSRDRQHIREGKNSGRPAKKNLHLRPQNIENDEKEDSYQEQLKDWENSQSNDRKLSFQVMDIFLNFFYEVGHEKGLVFNQNQRSELRIKSNRDSHGNKIEWTPKHQWDPIKEAIKLKKIAGSFDFDFEASENKEFYDLIMEVSPIFAQQFTEEVYKMLLTIKMIELGKQTRNSINNRLNLYESTKSQTFEPQGVEKFLKQNTISKVQNQKDIKNMNEKQQIEGISLKLNDFSTIIRENYKGNYFFLSFQFKKIKERVNSSKSTKQINRRAAYQKLVNQLYNTIKRIQVKTE